MVIIIHKILVSFISDQSRYYCQTRITSLKIPKIVNKNFVNILLESLCCNCSIKAKIYHKKASEIKQTMGHYNSCSKGEIPASISLLPFTFNGCIQLKKLKKCISKNFRILKKSVQKDLCCWISTEPISRKTNFSNTA